jgi:hypothetical protein
VTGALLVVAHEWVHADQYAAGRPFAEREADRLGWQRIPYLRHALLRR